VRVSSGKTCGDSVVVSECERKTNMAPEQEALYALQWNVPRSELSMAAQLEYDRLMPAWERGEVRPAAGELEAARRAWEQDTARQAREQDTARQADERDGLLAVWERKRAEKLAARETGLAWGHRVDRSGTIHTFRFQRGLLIFGAVMVLAFAAAFFALAVAGPLSGWSPDVGMSKGNEIWAIGAGLLCLWLGIRLLRVAVEISAGKMTIRSYFRTRTVNVGEIRAISLQSKSMSGGGSQWIPRVDLTDGRSIWINNMECGPVDRPPKSYLAASFDEIRGVLGVGADDTGQPETHQRA
jgi:hypothetical protein